MKLPAAWLLEQAGFHKSFEDGEGGISSRHTLALINRGHATHADIARLRDRIVQTVQTRFHITLEQEPVEP
jgi:UDP-N-acetylmuramate dehydrogenase